MKTRRIACVLWIVVVCMGGATVGARRPMVAVPISEPGVVHPPQREPIPPATLQEMYRTELGSAYDPVQADQLKSAHQLLEKYFGARSAGERKAIVHALEATRVDPNVLGRLCRIRSDWPALAGGTVYYVNRKVGPFAVRYFLGVPKAYDRAKAWPLAIELPGAAAFLTGSPPDAQRVVEIYTAWIREELSSHGDALVLMPLLNLDELYGPSYAGMNGVIQSMLDAAEQANIDPARVYMAGHSMAAYGVWALALHYPTYFAAINPLAGAANDDYLRVRLMNLRNVLPVVWHDDDDKVIKVNFSKSLVTALRNLKVEVDFNETRGVGHAPTPKISEEEYRKMRSRVRDLYPPQVWLQTDRPDIQFNRSDWLQVYQAMTPGREQRMFFRHGSGHMTVYENSCSVKAEVHHNRIDAVADNVDSMRFYVNDQMVNLAEPVTVVVNKKGKFEALVKPSVEEMLRDQLFLGRGWRYFTGVIDIELGEVTTTRPATTKPTHKGRIIVGPPLDESSR